MILIWLGAWTMALTSGDGMVGLEWLVLVACVLLAVLLLIGGYKLSPFDKPRRPAAVTAVLYIAGGLLVFAALGAMAIPGLLPRIERGKQKRSLAAMQQIDDAVEAYTDEHGTHPPAADIDALAALLEPRYVRDMQRIDGWDRPFRIEIGESIFAIQSSGSDGLFEDDPTRGGLYEFEADIALRNGQFTQWPEGLLGSVGAGR